MGAQAHSIPAHLDARSLNVLEKYFQVVVAVLHPDAVPVTAEVESGHLKPPGQERGGRLPPIGISSEPMKKQERLARRSPSNDIQPSHEDAPDSTISPVLIS